MKFNFKKIGAKFLVLLLFLEIVSFFYISSLLNKTLPERYFSFYQQYSENVNHLRGIHKKTSIKQYPNPESMIFNLIGSGNKTILLQGDSWAEAFNENKRSLNSLETFSSKYDVQFVNAGTSSYSPSLMTAQLDLLRKKFGVNFNQVIAIINQTDLGDELCRYKNVRNYKNWKVSVRPYSKLDKMEFYNYSYFFDNFEAFRSRNLSLVKIAWLAKNEIKQKFFSENPRCSLQELIKPLKYGVNYENLNYLHLVINDYIKEVFLQNNVKNLMIISVPYRGHLNKEYRLEVQDIIQSVVAESRYKNKIKIVRIKNQDLQNFKIGDPYGDDKFSTHLTSEAHAELLTKKILMELK